MFLVREFCMLIIKLSNVFTPASSLSSFSMKLCRSLVSVGMPANKKQKQEREMLAGRKALDSVEMCAVEHSNQKEM